MTDPVLESIEVRGITLAVERRGNLEGPVAFLHPGSGADHHALSPQAKYLASRGYTTLVPDIRGLGASDRPDDGYDVKTLASDGLSILRAFGVKRALLLGQSLGSAVIQEMALSDPSLVSGMVLMATWCRSDAFLRLQFALTQGIVAGQPPEVYAPALLYLIVSRTYVTQDETALKGLLRGMFLGRRSPGRDMLLNHLSAGRDHDTFDRLPVLDVPALVLSGERDLMIPAVYGAETARRLPRGRHVLLTGDRASHLFHWEMQDEVARSIEAFLPSVRA